MTHETLPVEELPVSPATQELVHTIATAEYKSQLRGLGGSVLAKEVRAGNIPIGEMDIITSEVQARRKLLSAPSNAEPEELPEPSTTEQPWSPSAIVDSIPAREGYDWAERAANEHNDRQKD